MSKIMELVRRVLVSESNEDLNLIQAEVTRMEAELEAAKDNVYQLTRLADARMIDKSAMKAERDMLDRCMAVCESRITPGTGSHAILMGAANEMKELLNEH